jgi:hypothetical protein
VEVISHLLRVELQTAQTNTVSLWASGAGREVKRHYMRKGRHLELGGR